jgi:hypothetical protein
MSLLVSVFHPVHRQLLDGLDRMVGFESCRQGLYGSELAQQLGLTLLPELALGNLTVEYEQLETLEQETYVLLDQVTQFSVVSQLTPDYIRARIENLQAAITEARSLGGGVFIG